MANGHGKRDCIPFTGYVMPNGYGQKWSPISRKVTSAHRAAWEIHHNAVALKGSHVDHLCKNPICVNINHLELVTSAENTRRGDAGKKTGAMQKSKTHCPQGHEYSESNTYIQPSSGDRYCRICIKASRKRSRERRSGRVSR